MTTTVREDRKTAEPNQHLDYVIRPNSFITLLETFHNVVFLINILVI